MSKSNRRKFLRQSVTAATGLVLAPTLIGCGAKNTASSTSPAPAAAPEKEGRLGIALLGLGGYAKGQIAPSLQHTKHCYLAGIVTGSPEKIPEWQQQYGIKDENVYSYDTMEELADNPEIDVVYVITPTATHRDFAVRAANAGKHVWCEKPMAMTPAAMTAASSPSLIQQQHQRKPASAVSRAQYRRATMAVTVRVLARARVSIQHEHMRALRLARQRCS